MRKHADFQWVTLPLAIYGSHLGAYDNMLRLQFVIDEKCDDRIKKVPIYQVNGRYVLKIIGVWFRQKMKAFMQFVRND